jgi:hypothetical protein
MLPIALAHGHTRETTFPRDEQGMFCVQPGCNWYFKRAQPSDHEVKQDAKAAAAGKE